MKTFEIKTTEKLSKFLLKAYEGDLSFSRLNKLFRQKDIKVNGERIKADLIVNAGDKVEVYFDGENLAKSNLYSVVFEDENILCVNKNKGVTSEVLFKSLQSKYSEIHFCHRLDRNTDGIMVFAKNIQAYNSIFQGFKNKVFEKYYEAEVYGKLKEKKGVLVDFILKKEIQSKVEIYSQFIIGSKKAVLEYEVISELENSSILRIKLLTGRTHQIRAQLGKRGNFVLGDGKYGNDIINKSLDVSQTKLCAKKLIFHFNKGDFLYYLDKKVIEI